jgi:gliding motility-associated-like protein
MVVNDEGCESTFSNIIKIDNKPQVDFNVNNSSGCAPLTVDFLNLSIAPSNSSYFWTFGNGNTSVMKDPSVIYDSIGFYAVKQVITTTQGCSDSLTKDNFISLQNGPVALFSASSEKAIVPLANISFMDLSENNSNPYWIFGDGYYSDLNNPEHTYLDTGNFEVCLVASSSYGCKDTSCIEVYISGSNEIALPSAFSPNGDNNNDIFMILGGPFLEIELKIYNEWGNQIFISSSQEVGWDGTFEGTIQPIGAYEYTIKGKSLDNQEINLYGVVHLTR